MLEPELYLRFKSVASLLRSLPVMRAPFLSSGTLASHVQKRSRLAAVAMIAGLSPEKRRASMFAQ